MAFRKMIVVFVLALPVLLVSFSVAMGAYLLLQATGDTAGAAVLRGVGVAVLLLGIVDLVLLVGALGMHSLVGDHSPVENSHRPPPG